MKKYVVIDLQGCDFMRDTHEEPLTLNELRNRFWWLDEEDTRTKEYKDFTSNYIQEIWEVEFKDFNEVVKEEIIENLK